MANEDKDVAINTDTDKLTAAIGRQLEEYLTVERPIGDIIWLIAFFEIKKMRLYEKKMRPWLVQQEYENSLPKQE